MVSALVPGSSGPGSSPGRGQCAMFLGKTLYSHRTGELDTGGNSAMDYNPIQGGVEILLVASCYRNRDKLRPDGPLGSYADIQLMRIEKLTIWLGSCCVIQLNSLNLCYEKCIEITMENVYADITTWLKLEQLLLRTFASLVCDVT